MKNQSRKMKDLVSVEKEVSLLRSALIGFMGRDEEGSYNPEFVKDILEAPEEEACLEFKGKKDFLKILSEV